MTASFRALTFVGAALALSAGAAAQNADLLLIQDGFDTSVMPTLAEDQLVRLDDLDGNGDYFDNLETNLWFRFQAATQADNNEFKTARVVDEGGILATYLVNNRGNGGFRPELLRGVDSNGSGRLEASEMVELFNFETATGSSQGAEGVAISADGAAWGSSDFPGGSIIRSLGGTTTVFIDDANGPFLATDQNGGLSTIDTDDFTRMTGSGNGVLVFIDGFSDDRTEAIFRFEDANGNGSADNDELRPFLIPTDINPAWAKNPDFGVSLRSFEIDNPAAPAAGEPPYFVPRLSHLTTTVESGVETYYFATDSSDSGMFSLNVNGDGLNGLVYRAQDGNSDGDVNDSGEVELFFDGSTTGPTALGIGKVLGMDAADGTIYIFGLTGAATIATLTDFNNDGDAADAGEFTSGLWDEAGFLFFGPSPIETFMFGVGLAAVPNGLLPDALSLDAEVSGVGCTQFGLIPTISGVGDFQVGTSNFTAIMGNGLPGQPSVLLAGNTATVGGLPLPLDLGVINPNLAGCTLYQAAKFIFPVVNDGLGNATFPVGLPNNPALSGITLGFQWLTTEVSVGNVNSALTPLMSATIQ